MTPINYLSPDDSGDGDRLDVSHDRQTVWLPDLLAEGCDPEWTRALVSRYEDAIDDEGYPLPEMVAACRADRVFTAVAAGRQSVDLDVSRVVADVAWQLRADALAERRHGHPSLSAAERGV